MKKYLIFLYTSVFAQNILNIKRKKSVWILFLNTFLWRSLKKNTFETDPYRKPSLYSRCQVHCQQPMYDHTMDGTMDDQETMCDSGRIVAAHTQPQATISCCICYCCSVLTSRPGLERPWHLLLVSTADWYFPVLLALMCTVHLV